MGINVSQVSKSSGVLELSCISLWEPTVKSSGILEASWHYIDTFKLAMYYPMEISIMVFTPWKLVNAANWDFILFLEKLVVKCLPVHYWLWIIKRTKIDFLLLFIFKRGFRVWQVLLWKAEYRRHGEGKLWQRWRPMDPVQQTVSGQLGA